MNDLGNAFSYPFKDQNWLTKFIIGAVFMILSLVLVGIFFLAGYFVEVTQRVIRREQNPLPEWDNLGEKFILGIKLCIVYLVYIIPIILLYIPFFLLITLGAVVDGADFDGGATSTMAASYFMIAAFGLITPYSLALTVLGPIIIYRFALNGKISEALDVAEIFRSFRRNWQSTLVVALIAVGIQAFAWVGIVAVFVGVFFTLMYSYLVSSYMYGALYLEHNPVTTS